VKADGAEVEVAGVKVAEVKETELSVADVKEVWEPGSNVTPTSSLCHLYSRLVVKGLTCHRSSGPFGCGSLE